MKKQAILFSAGDYFKSELIEISDLPWVKRDILTMEKRLNQIGFEVRKKENAHKDEYLPILKSMVEKAPSDAINIVYFTGHGGHYNGENYIYPIDMGTRFDSSKDMSKSSVSIRDIISVFKGKGKLILILDSCRRDIWRSKGYYSEMVTSQDVYIAYGAIFENVSYGSDGISWFTEAICDEILTPNINIDLLFTRIRQNVFIKHSIQIPASVNTLLDDVILHSEFNHSNIDEKVYNFISQYGDEYDKKYGCFHGDDLIFIDAAQYFNIGLLDAIWSFKKVDNKIFKARGVKVPELTEAETKVSSFLGFVRGEKYFSFDESHTWYYNGRPIRMGEIPPLPPSMQQRLPEKGKEILVNFNAVKEDNKITITTNLPDYCSLMVWDNVQNSEINLEINSGRILIEDADAITNIKINCCVAASNDLLKNKLGPSACNLVGRFVKYNPRYGNYIKCCFEF